VYAEALAWLEASGLGHAARHSGALFAAVNTLHVLGAALLVGGIAVFDVKVLADRGAGAQDVGRIALPLAALGLLLHIPTGLTLLAVEARALGVNPAFLAKLGFIALGLVNLAVFHARFGHATGPGGSLPASARPLAPISLAAWTLTLIAGRMIAYL
jgi:hypothetical protein